MSPGFSKANLKNHVTKGNESHKQLPATKARKNTVANKHTQGLMTQNKYRWPEGDQTPLGKLVMGMCGQLGRELIMVIAYEHDSAQHIRNDTSWHSYFGNLPLIYCKQLPESKEAKLF